MNLQGYKTYLVSMLTFLLGAVFEVLQHTDPADIIRNPKVGAGVMLGSLVTIIMRKVTAATTEAALKTPPPTQSSAAEGP